jgi:hypothetical protein
MNVILSEAKDLNNQRFYADPSLRFAPFRMTIKLYQCFHQ